MPFAALGLSPSLSTPLARLGYTTPTPVQVKSIPVVLTGKDLLARAQTGTGKTAAFGLPMIDRLLVRGGVAAGMRKPRGLVLVPTRELALQVHKSLSTYGVPANLRVTAIFGGVSIVPQKRELVRGTDIIVATPGRLLDHMEQRTVDLSGIQILTLDEADRMLDMGFLPPLRRILKVLPRDRQTLLFSATISPEVVKLSADFTRDPQRVDVSEGQVMASTVTHRVHPVTDQRKGDLLTHVLRETPGAPGAGVLQDQARLESRRAVPRTRRHRRRRDPRQQEPGRADQGARGLQGRSRHRIGGHRHCRTWSRHSAAAAGRQLRSAAGARGLHPSRRPHGSRGPRGPSGVARVTGGSRSATRHSATADVADRARHDRGICDNRRIARCAAGGGPPPSGRSQSRVSAAIIARAASSQSGRVRRDPVAPDGVRRDRARALTRVRTVRTVRMVRTVH